MAGRDPERTLDHPESGLRRISMVAIAAASRAIGLSTEWKGRVEASIEAGATLVQQFPVAPRLNYLADNCIFLMAKMNTIPFPLGCACMLILIAGCAIDQSKSIEEKKLRDNVIACSAGLGHPEKTQGDIGARYDAARESGKNVADAVRETGSTVIEQIEPAERFSVYGKYIECVYRGINLTPPAIVTAYTIVTTLEAFGTAIQTTREDKPITRHEVPATQQSRDVDTFCFADPDMRVLSIEPMRQDYECHPSLEPWKIGTPGPNCAQVNWTVNACQSKAGWVTYIARLVGDKNIEQTPISFSETYSGTLKTGQEVSYTTQFPMKKIAGWNTKQITAKVDIARTLEGQELPPISLSSSSNPTAPAATVSVNQSAGQATVTIRQK